MPEMKPLSNRFTFFEHFEEKKEAEQEKHRSKKGQRKATRDGQIDTPDSRYMERVFQEKIPYNRKIN